LSFPSLLAHRVELLALAPHFSPHRATYVLGVRCVLVNLRINGPFGPCGTDAVVMTSSLQSVAILAGAAARSRRSGIGMSQTVWNRPLW